MFVMANGVSTADQPVHLFACCDPDLQAKVTATDDNILSSNIDEMLKLLRSLSVVPVAINVQRSELLRMQQQPGEAIRTFFSRVRGKAITCRLQLECAEEHTGEPRCVSVNYTNDIIKHVVIAGIYNEDVRRDVYGIQDADTMSVHNLIAFIESKEVAREATQAAGSVNVMSQFKKSKAQPEKIQAQHGKVQQGTCSSCKKTFELFRKMRNGKFNKKPFKECYECFKMKSVNTVDQAYSDTDAVTFDLALIDKGSDQSMEVELIAGVESTSKYIPYQLFKENEWISQASSPHPKVNLLISTEESDYARFGYHYPQ